MSFLVYTSPKRLDIATTNFAGAYSRSHDVEGTGQSFVSQGQRQKSRYLRLGIINCSLVFHPRVIHVCSHILPPPLQDPWPCEQLLCAECHAPYDSETWPTTKPNLQHL